MKSLSEVVERQSVIISEQSKIINELFQLLNNYLTVEELDNMPIVNRINELAKLYD